MKKEYVCECGKVFTKPNSFNGHKSNCKVHHLAKYGSLDKFNEKYNNASLNCSKTNLGKTRLVKEQKLQQWISEQHTCEKCGKVMTEKYGSGRFCSRECANSRTFSEESKHKKRISAKNNNYNSHKAHLIKYENNSNFCQVCNTKLDYEHRFRKTCSEQCKLILASRNLKNNPNAGGLRKGSGTGKHGTYKGFYCDSTYELAYIIYNIDHNIKFKRNKTYYNYYFKGKLRRYYPDFELEDGSLVEIKGYYTETVKAKLEAVKDKPIKILYRKDLDYAFNWVKENYSYKKLEDLYE